MDTYGYVSLYIVGFVSWGMFWGIFLASILSTNTIGHRDDWDNRKIVAQFVIITPMWPFGVLGVLVFAIQKSGAIVIKTALGRD